MTEKYEVNITLHAQSDLEHIFDYITSDSISRGSNFVSEIEKKILSLEHFPNRNPFIPENLYFGTDYRHLIYKKYRIIYRTTKNLVFILRIIQGAKLLDF